MVAMILPRALRRQPQQAPQIDWSNPIALGLTAVFVGSASYDPVSGRQFVNSVANNRSVCQHGMGVDGRLGQANLTLAGSGTVSTGSIFVVVTTSDASSEQIILELGPSAPFADGVRGIRMNAGKIGTYTRNLYEVASPTSYRTNVPIAIGTTYAAAAAALYIDGVLVNSGTTKDTTSLAAALNIGGIVAQSAQYFLRGAVPVAYVWNRVLSATEMALVSANPWLLLKAPIQVVQTSLAQNAYALVAGAGSFAISGVAASVRAGRRLPAAVGAYAVGAMASGLIASRRLPAAPGAMMLIGRSVGLAAARRLAAGVGAFALSGRTGSMVALKRVDWLDICDGCSSRIVCLGGRHCSGSHQTPPGGSARRIRAHRARCGAAHRPPAAC
jgi:hypothetical protein